MVINGGIDDNTSNSVVAQLLFLESQAPDKPVRATTNSITELGPQEAACRNPSASNSRRDSHC